MGINGGGFLLHSVKGLSFDEVKVILKALRDSRCMLQESSTDVTALNSYPIVGIDISVLAHKPAGKRELVADGCWKIVLAVAQGGANVVIVTDHGGYWHHSKQASILRRARNDKANAKALAIRAEILQLTTQLRLSSDNYGVRPSEIKERLASLEKELKTKEKTAGQGLLPLDGLFPNLQRKVIAYHPADGHGHIQLYDAMFQADSRLSSLYKNGTIDVMLSNSDFAVYIPSCLLLKDFKLVPATKKQCTTLNKMEITSASWSTVDTCLTAIKQSGTSDGIKKAMYSFLSDMPHILDRAIAVIGLGCNQYLVGIKGVGPAGMQQIVEKNKGVCTSGDIMLDHFIKNKDCRLKSKDTLLALAKAFVFEPCSVMKDETTSEELIFFNIAGPLFFDNW